jgi:stage V sporulation protein S
VEGGRLLALNLSGRVTQPRTEDSTLETLRVSAQSNPKSLAGALAAVLREKGVAEMQAVGAGAVNQAVKAIAIARGFVAPNGIDLVSVPAFAEIEIDGEARTAIRFIVQPR